MKTMIISLLFVLTSSMTILAQSKKVQKLKKDYIESAILELNNQKLTLFKWENKDTLRYHVSGEFQFMSKKNWEKYLSTIENLINIKIVETKNSDAADIGIYFGELNDYFTKFNIKSTGNAFIKDFDNWSSRNYNQKKQLTKTTFCIVPSKTKESKRGYFNIQRLFLKSLGFLGKLENDYSVFNKFRTINNTHLSKNDKKIIKIHYDNSIKAGMDIDELKLALYSVDIETILKEKY